MIILKSLHISNHAKERYAERNMHATKLEVPMFVDKYDTKIQDDISKMVEYGELIYTGNNPAQEHRKQNIISRELQTPRERNRRGIRNILKH